MIPGGHPLYISPGLPRQVEVPVQLRLDMLHCIGPARNVSRCATASIVGADGRDSHVNVDGADISYKRS